MNHGIRYSIIAVLVFSAMTLGIKAIPAIPSYEIVFFRGLISLALCFYSLRRANIPYFGKNKPILLLRGAAGTVALLCYFYTIQEMPLATASVLQNLSPLFTILIGWLWLKEGFRPIQGLCFLAAFAGVAMIKGYDPRVSSVLVGIGIGSALLSGVAYNCVRHLRTSEHPLVVVMYFPLVVVPTVGPYTVLNFVWPSLWELAVLLYIGITTQVAQYYMTRAYQAERATKVSLFNYLGTVFALVFGYLIFNETIPLASLAGMGVVLVALIANTVFSRAGRRNSVAKVG